LRYDSNVILKIENDEIELNEVIYSIREWHLGLLEWSVFCFQKEEWKYFEDQKKIIEYGWRMKIST